MKIPKTHPRYESLRIRNLIVNGVKNGITSMHGLLAHGRGEAFDYLIGEKTSDMAKKSIEAAAALLLSAKNPVISVNGNVSSLVSKEIVKLAKSVSAKIEVNIFHKSKARELKIKKHLIKNGADEVLFPQKSCKIKYLSSNRKYVNKEGIFNADVVFVPLEDGDRTEALVKNGKKVITIDLNPLSRTSSHADITIIDNIIRAMPLLISRVKELKRFVRKDLARIIGSYDNKKVLEECKKMIGDNIQ